MGAGCVTSPLTLSFVLPCSGVGDTATVWDRVGWGDVVPLCGGDFGIGMASSSGDGMVCMFLELVPRRSGFRCGLDRFSGDGGRSAAFLLSFRLPITVPSRLNPKR